MSAEWKLVLDEEALNVLLACRVAERRKLLVALDNLKKHPYQTGDFIEHDDTGHPLQVKVFGAFLLTWWLDSYVTELRVVEIERVRVNR